MANHQSNLQQYKDNAEPIWKHMSELNHNVKIIKKTFDIGDDLYSEITMHNRKLVKNEELPGIGYVDCFKTSRLDDKSGAAILKGDDFIVKVCSLNNTIPHGHSFEYKFGRLQNLVEL